MTDEIKNYTITLDDDPLVHKIIQKYTAMSSLPFVSGANLLQRGKSYRPIAVFFDVHLEHGESGIDIIPKCRDLWPYAAFFVITADEDSQLIGQALASGANDFLRKPLSHSELVARFRARTSEMTERQLREHLAFADFDLNVRQGLLQSSDRRVWLPPLETALLKLLIEYRENIVSRDIVKRQLWGEVHVADNTLDQKISHLRKALAHLGSTASIRTVYGKGIRLAPAENSNRQEKAS